MADSSILILQSDGVTTAALATDLTGGVHTPKHLAIQSGTWTVGGTVAVSGSVAVTGTFWQATQPVSGTVAATQSGSWTVALSGVTFAKDAVAGASDAGIQALAVRKNFPAGVTPADGDYTNLVTDSRGNLYVHPTASYSGGAQSSRKISAATTNATSVATSAANLLSVVAMNNHATAVAYLKIYDKASSPTVGTDTPLFTFALAPVGGGVAIAFPTGVALANGLAYAITTGMADSDTGAVALSQVTVNLTYQWSA